MNKIEIKCVAQKGGCQIHIVNENLGEGWHPTITTDSEALSFLNEAEFTESLEERRIGPMVRIFAQLP